MQTEAMAEIEGWLNEAPSEEEWVRRERVLVHEMGFDAWAHYLFPEYMGLPTPRRHPRPPPSASTSGTRRTTRT